MNKKVKNHKRLWTLFCVVTIVFLGLWGGIIYWWNAVEAGAHVTPEYPKENIEALIQKGTQGAVLSNREYETFFRQTGLGVAAVDFLFENGRQQELLDLQEAFFAEIEVECEANTIVTREERIVPGATEQNGRETSTEAYATPFIPYVENGDILISFNSHALGWRNGHAAIVVDAEKRLTLEARVLGTNTTVMSMEHWERYPSFAVLRLKDATKEQRAEIAAHAVESLTDVPYRLEAGILERWRERMPWRRREFASGLRQAGLSGTHCSHLVWLAYRNFGYDLDSDGGLIVTPRDLYESPKLEIVQAYGLPISGDNS